MHHVLIFNVSFLFLVLFVLSFLIEENIKKIQLLHFILFLLFLTNLFSSDFHFETLNFMETVSFKLNSVFEMNTINWSYYYDIDLYTYFSFFFSIIFLSFLFLGYCDQFLLKENKDFEFSWLISLFFLTAIFMLVSVNLIEIFICLECMSFCSYILVSLERSNKLSAMSGIRYLIISSIPSSLLILGIIYIYENYATFSRNNLELFLQFYNDSSNIQDILLIEKDFLINNSSFIEHASKTLNELTLSFKDSILLTENTNMHDKNIRIFDIITEITDSIWKLLLVFKDYETNQTLNLPTSLNIFEDKIILYFETILKPAGNDLLDAIEYFQKFDNKQMFENFTYEEYISNLKSLEVLGEVIIPTFDINEKPKVNSVDYGFQLLEANLDLDPKLKEFTQHLLTIEKFINQSVEFWNDKELLILLESRLRFDYMSLLSEQLNFLSSNYAFAGIFSNGIFPNFLITNRCNRLDLLGELSSLYYSFKVLNIEFFNNNIELLNSSNLDKHFIDNSYWWSDFVNPAYVEAFKENSITEVLKLVDLKKITWNFNNFDNFFENLDQLLNIEILNNKYFFISINIAILLIIINLSFKLTAAPFHVWAPSVYNNAATASVSFLAIFSKIILFLFAIKIFSTTFYDLKLYWSYLFFFISISSIVMGMIGAFGEKFLKKFFVYSSMSDVGFILLGLSFYSFEISKNLINYIFVYNLSSIIIWFMLLYFRRQTKFLVNLQYILAGDIILTLIFALNIFSLAGIPPFGGFFIKLDILNYLILSSNFGVGFFVLLLTVFNFFYYLRLIKIIYFEKNNFNLINNNIEPYKLFIFAFIINIICGYELFMQNSYIYILQYITKSLL